ncbi:MAG: hypothetical protein QXP52_00380 [Candidatus Aenigmatarchaeota archaeon]
MSILLYFSYIQIPIELTPSKISEDFLGRKIRVSGSVVEIIKKEKVNYIIISDGIKNFTITIFPNVFKFIENKIYKDAKIEVIGILSVYRENLQIILQNPKNIKIIND